MPTVFYNCFLVAICAVVRPWESLIIGFIGGLIACTGCTALLKLRIDDPVGCVPTHFFASVWGLLAVGLFVEKDSLENLSEDYGVFKGGSWRMLGVQLLATIAVGAWAATITFILLYLVNKIIKLRMPLEMELAGADLWEHGIGEEEKETMETTEVVTTNGVDNPCVVNEDDVINEENNTTDKIPNRKTEHTEVHFHLKERSEVIQTKSKQHTWKRRINTRSHSVDVESVCTRNGDESTPNEARNLRELSVGELDRS